MVTLFKRGEKGINGHVRIAYVFKGKKTVAKGVWPRFLTVENVTFCTSEPVIIDLQSGVYQLFEVRRRNPQLIR